MMGWVANILPRQPLTFPLPLPMEERKVIGGRWGTPSMRRSTGTGNR